MRVAIAQAEGEADMAAVRGLCVDFVTWLHTRYPDMRAAVDSLYGPAIFDALMADLPRLHAPPGGAILLARRDGAPVGCAMLARMDDGYCEAKRVFVAPEARGLGLGRALMAALAQAARDAGYRAMRLDTGPRHDEAIALYESLGFRRVAPYAALPPEVRDVAVFMERTL